MTVRTMETPVLMHIRWKRLDRRLQIPFHGAVAFHTRILGVQYSSQAEEEENPNKWTMDRSSRIHRQYPKRENVTR